MGHMSLLLCCSNDARRCQIRWKKISTKRFCSAYNLLAAYNARDKIHTLEDLAQFLSGKKMFGYLDKAYIDGFYELSRCLTEQPCRPRIYYEQENLDSISFLEFMPGKEYVDIGCYALKDGEFLRFMPCEEVTKRLTCEDKRRLGMLNMILTSNVAWTIDPLNVTAERWIEKYLN